MNKLFSISGNNTQWYESANHPTEIVNKYWPDKRDNTKLTQVALNKWILEINQTRYDFIGQF
jgi:hypothetical protein